MRSGVGRPTVGGDAMRVAFLGVRGSTPAPGAEFVRYGGHTSCLTVAHDGDENPALVLDAGTGLRRLTAQLSGAAFHGSIVLSHLHWDHVQGIPFFAAGDRGDSRVDLFLPAFDARSARDLLGQMMSPPAFPITPDGLKGEWTFTAIEAEPRYLEGFLVTPFDISHKGGRSFGFRIDAAGSSFAYVPDHAPAAGVSATALDIMQGVDLLVHDAQFLSHERPRAVDYGHATIDEAISLAHVVRAGGLVLFHHSPHRTDDALDVIAEAFCDDYVSIAFEGLVRTV